MNDQEHSHGIRNTGHAFVDTSCDNIFNEALSPEDVAELIRDAEIVFAEDSFVPQQQSEEDSEMETLKSNEKQQPQNNKIHLIGVSSSIEEHETEETKKVTDITQENNVDMSATKANGKQKEPQSHEINLIDEEAELPVEKYSDIEETTDEISIQDTGVPGEETEMECSDSSDNEGQIGKRKRIKKQKKRELNKKLRMKGENYIGFRKPKGQKNTFHDIPRDKRRLKPRCLCKDPSKQCIKFTEEDRKNIFSNFWSDMSWEQRKVFVAATVKVCDRKRPDKDNSRRSITLKYHLILNNTHLPVCKLMYLNTLSLGEWSVRSWTLSANNGMVKSAEVEVSLRPKREDIFKEDRKFLEEFLTHLNKLPSHYCRKDTDQLYLEQYFQSWNDLFRVYEKHCKDENRKVLSSKLLRQVAKNMKIALFSPRKDQCDLCFMFKNGNVSEEVYRAHINKKEAARAEKEKDKIEALNGLCHVITMDVQAVKLSPQIPASTLYYKTKLCCHNFTLYDLATKKVVCYWYNEIQADGQASTYASFLLDYLEDSFLNDGDKKPIILYSDGCTAQNRNAILANALLYLSEKHNVKITQKFLEKGHTQMECDSVHSTIERRLKNREIYLPSDYLRVTREARSSSPYIAKEKDFHFFRDFANKDLMKYRSIRPSKTSVVVDIRTLQYHQGTIKYKLDFNNELFDELPNRPRKIKDFELTEFPALYTQRNKITRTKYDHLQAIKKCIPQDCWEFYDNLPFHAK